MSDEPLISTDVDEILRLLRARRSVEFQTGAELLGMRPNDFIKWAHVLEAEGHAHIDYRLTKRYLTYAGSANELDLSNYEPRQRNIEITSYRETPPKASEFEDVLERERAYRAMRGGRESKGEEKETEREQQLREARAKSQKKNIEIETPEEATEEGEEELDAPVRAEPEPEEEADFEEQGEIAQYPGLEKKEEKRRWDFREGEEQRIEPTTRKARDMLGEQETGTAEEPFTVKTITEEEEEYERKMKHEHDYESTYKEHKGIDLFSIFSKQRIPTLEEEVRRAEEEMRASESLSDLVDGARQKMELEMRERKAMEHAAAERELAEREALENEQKAFKEQRAAEEIRKAEEERGRPRALGSLSTSMSQRMSCINSKLDELAKLKAEKEKLLREHYVPIEKKIEAELETISERIMNKEKEILALEKRLMELPVKVSETEEISYKIGDLDHEAKKAYDEVDSHLRVSLAEIETMRSSFSQRLNESERRLHSDSAKVEETGKLLARVGALEHDAQKAIDAANANIDEQARKVELAAEQLQSLSSVRAGVQEELDRFSKEIDTQEEEISEMSRELSRIGEIEAWIDEYRKSYSRRLAEFSDLVRQSEKDYYTLRESVEKNFARKYLKELRTLEEGHRFDMGAAAEKEKSIDERISRVKMEIDGYIKESRELAEVFERGMSSGKDEQPSTDELGRRHEQLYSRMHDMGSERDTIARSIDSLRASRYPARELPNFEEEKEPSGEKAGRIDLHSVYGKTAPASAHRAQKKGKKGRKK